MSARDSPATCKGLLDISTKKKKRPFTGNSFLALRARSAADCYFTNSNAFSQMSSPEMPWLPTGKIPTISLSNTEIRLLHLNNDQYFDTDQFPHGTCVF